MYRFVCEDGSSTIKQLSSLTYNKSSARLLAMNAELGKRTNIYNNNKNGLILMLKMILVNI